MSSLGDKPLAKTRKRKNAAQADAEQAQVSRKARNLEGATASVHDLPQPTQAMTTATTSNSIAYLSEFIAVISDRAWLRIIPKQSEGITHWYVKWNAGKWKNHYIYYGQHPSDSVLDAISFLTIRFSEVEGGLRKPFKDSVYSGY